MTRPDPPRLGAALPSVPIGEHVIRVLEEIDRRQRHPAPHLPVRSGIPALDEVLPGSAPLLHVVTGRRSIGKTALALRIAYESARAGVPVSLYSLEGAPGVLSARLLCGTSGLDWRRALNGAVSAEEWARLARAAEELGGLPIRLVNAPFATAETVMSTERAAEAAGLPAAAVIADGVRHADADVLASLARIADEIRRPVIATVDHARRARRGPGTLRPPMPEHAFVLHLEEGEPEQGGARGPLRPLVLRVGQQSDALRKVPVVLHAPTSWIGAKATPESATPT